jgi:hypothetical protein
MATICPWRMTILKSQNKGGHTDHYRKHFPIKRSEKAALIQKSIG